MIDRLVDTSSVINKTNGSTVSGISAFGVGVKLAMIPYPPLQVVGGLLCLAGTVAAFWKPADRQ